MEYLESKFFLLAITFGFFFLSKQLQKKTGLIILNPILIAIALLICFLKLTNVSYEKYYEAGSLIEFWLKPAVVALGVPLYLQLRMIKKQLMKELKKNEFYVCGHTHSAEIDTKNRFINTGVIKDGLAQYIHISEQGFTPNNTIYY